MNFENWLKTLADEGGAGGVGGGDHRAWAPPQGQTGDGTTALNERFGY